MALNYARNIVQNNASRWAAINDELEKIQTALADGLSRSGNSPNALGTDLDGGGNDVVNVGALSVQSFTVGGGAVPSLNDIIDTYAATVDAKDLAEAAATSAGADATTASNAAASAAADSASADASAAAAALSETAAGISETNAESDRVAAQSAAAFADNRATNALTYATNASNSADAAAMSEANAGTSETNAAQDADDAEAARIAAEAAAAGVNLPPVTAGTEGQFLRVNSAEDGYDLSDFYQETTVDLTGNGDFVGGTLLVTKVGRQVTITAIGASTNELSTTASSTPGTVPTWARPEPTSSRSQVNYVVAPTSSQTTATLSNGTFLVETDIPVESPFTAPTVTYNV